MVGPSSLLMNDLKPLVSWFSQLTSEPVVIAGPCSAESEQQVMKTARQVAQMGKAQVYRAGIWKPRTRPGSFEGVGTDGLKWLQQVKNETGLLVTTEVAHPKHIELALKYDIDILWIGARTTSNPFSVQELADSFKGLDIPLMIKNPINPDLELWVGAIERFYNAGLRKIAAIHRGFYPFEKTKLRNIPKWEIPIELKSRFHQLPIINDPSHIAGKIGFIREVAQKALDLNMNGLMIESHCNPEEALSDAEQQLKPEELKQLLADLVIRHISVDDLEFMNLLENLRDQIDSIDQQILELLSQRMNVVEKIGRYKARNKVTILQLKRWEDIITTRLRAGKSLGLTEEFIKKLLQLVHKESIQKQTEVMNRLNGKSK